MESHANAYMKRLNYLLSEIDAAYHEPAVKLGFSDSAMQVLYAICSNGEECPLQDITASGISKQTINSALRKLEKEDLVYLETIGRRKKKVCLTEQGKELVKDTVLRVLAIENEILESWTEEERALYVELQQRYLVSFREKTREWLS